MSAAILSRTRTALITGSTDINSLGFTAAFILASKHNFNVILTGRNEEAASSAAKEMTQRLSKNGSASTVSRPLLHFNPLACTDGV